MARLLISKNWKGHLHIIQWKQEVWIIALSEKLTKGEHALNDATDRHGFAQIWHPFTKYSNNPPDVWHLPIMHIGLWGNLLY